MIDIDRTSNDTTKNPVDQISSDMDLTNDTPTEESNDPMGSIVNKSSNVSGVLSLDWRRKKIEELT